jgi:hypothetical protein
MKTAQETFIVDCQEIARITVVEGVGILATLGCLEEGEFTQMRDDDVFYFTEHPELTGMYDFTANKWNMRAVMEFFTDAPDEDGSSDFKPVPSMPDDGAPDGLWLGGYVNYYEAVTHSDLSPDCAMCGKPTGKPRSDGKYYCSQCWMEWNS